MLPYRKTPSSFSTVPKSPPPCNSKSWGITSFQTFRLLCSRGEDEMREIASLTKIMTCYLALLLARDYRMDVHTLVPVSKRAASMIGTTADLRAGDRIQLIDLLHALMLPSGNDAAQTIAEYFGGKIAERKGFLSMTKKLDRLFVREMNVLAGALGMRRSFFQNPHGMSMKKNHSTVRDVGTLAASALRLPLFLSIVNTRSYTCSVPNKRVPVRTLTWENTNRLLFQGFDGVKTGVTDAAGPCLCASIKRGEQRIVITVLGARSMEERWVEVPRLASWAFDQLPSV